MSRRRFVFVLVSGLLCVTTAVGHDLEEEFGEIAGLVRLRPGMHVADVGAGSGDFGESLARRVEDSGRVYLTEINERELARMRRRFQKTDLFNLSVIEGEPDDTKLPDACCDLVLLRYVYHHMSDPDPMRASLWRSLRPGGLLLVIEKEEPGDGVAAAELIPAMVGDGFEVMSQHPEWGGHDNHYAVVFRRPQEARSSR